MDIMIKAAAASLVAAAAALTIKKSNPEIAFAAGVVCAVCIAMAAAGMLTSIKEFLQEIIGKSGISSAVFLPPLKCTAIAVISKTVSGLSKDAGQAGVAASVEYLGAAAAIFTLLPLISSILKAVEDLL